MNTLKREPIDNQQAARFYRQHIGGKLPAGLHWYAVEGLTISTSVFDASYLIAGDCGLYGIVGFKDVPTSDSAKVQEGAA